MRITNHTEEPVRQTSLKSFFLLLHILRLLLNNHFLSVCTCLQKDDDDDYEQTGLTDEDVDNTGIEQPVDDNNEDSMEENEEEYYEDDDGETTVEDIEIEEIAMDGDHHHDNDIDIDEDFSYEAGEGGDEMAAATSNLLADMEDVEDSGYGLNFG